MATEFEEIRRKLLEHKQQLLTRAAKVRADITRSSGPLDKDFAEQVVQMENDAVLAGIGATTAGPAVFRSVHYLRRIGPLNISPT